MSIDLCTPGHMQARHEEYQQHLQQQLEQEEAARRQEAQFQVSSC